MSVYGITGVRLDQAGKVAQAAIRQVDTARNALIGAPMLLEAPDLASLVVKGDTVYAIFELEEGQRVHGPKFRHVVFPGGAESVELEDDIPGRRLADLVQIGE